MNEKMISMNLADFMYIFEKYVRAVETDENEVLRYMVEFHNMLVKHGLVGEI